MRNILKLNLRFVSTAVLLLAGTGIAGAATPSFSNLSQSDFDNVIRELSANSGFHSVTGASSLGNIFGVELALVGGMTSTPEINRISQSIDPSASISSLPHAALLGAISIPFGITGEVLMFPSTTVSGVKYQQYAGAFKWTANTAIVLPFNVAVRGYFAKNELSFSETLNNSTTGNIPVDVTVTQENSQTGLQLLVSPGLPIIEPYAGIGYLSAKGKLSVSGSTSGTIFGFTSAQSAESSPTSVQYLLGVTANLLLFTVGGEYSRAFGTDTYNFKFGLKF